MDGNQIHPGDCLIVQVCAARLFVTPRPTACRAPLSMGFPRKECGNRLPFPSPGNLPEPGIKPRSPAWQVEFLLSEPPFVEDILRLEWTPETQSTYASSHPNCWVHGQDGYTGQRDDSLSGWDSMEWHKTSSHYSKQHEI